MRMRMFKVYNKLCNFHNNNNNNETCISSLPYVCFAKKVIIRFSISNLIFLMSARFLRKLHYFYSFIKLFSKFFIATKINILSNKNINNSCITSILSDNYKFLFSVNFPCTVNQIANYYNINKYKNSFTKNCICIYTF